MGRKRVPGTFPTVVAESGKQNQPEQIIKILQRASERLREARVKVPLLGSKTTKDLELADRLIEDLIAKVKGQPPKIQQDELPANLQRPNTSLFDPVFLESVRAAVLQAEQKGGRSKARAQVVRYIDWILQTKAGAPLKRETGILGRRVYIMLSRHMTVGQIAPHVCPQHHSHTRACAERLRQTAKRYADQVGLPWPPATESTKVKRNQIRQFNRAIIFLVLVGRAFNETNHHNRGVEQSTVRWVIGCRGHVVRALSPKRGTSHRGATDWIYEITSKRTNEAFLLSRVQHKLTSNESHRIARYDCMSRLQ